MTAAYNDSDHPELTAADKPERYLDIVFDAPPGHPSPGFVEVEDHLGQNVLLGEWVQRPDGYWVIRFDPVALGKSFGATSEPEPEPDLETREGEYEVDAASGAWVSPALGLAYDPNNVCGHYDPDEGTCILMAGHPSTPTYAGHWHSLFGPAPGNQVFDTKGGDQ